jgi:hypothetical protein
VGRLELKIFGRENRFSQLKVAILMVGLLLPTSGHRRAGDRSDRNQGEHQVHRDIQYGSRLGRRQEAVNNRYNIQSDKKK